VVGPVAMAYELVSQARDNPENWDLSLILSAATKGLQLLGMPTTIWPTNAEHKS